MSNKVKPENVTGIVQTWSGEKFVRRAISSSIFSKTDISEAAIMRKKIYCKSAIQINEVLVYMFRMTKEETRKTV